MELDEIKRGTLLGLKAYQGCPCLLQDRNKFFCLNEEELVEVLLVPTEGDALLWGRRGVCHNVVLTGEDGYLKCPSTGSHIRIRGKRILNELFEETLNLAKLAFTDLSSCNQCLYTLLESEVMKRKVSVLILGEKLDLEAYKKRVTESLKKLVPEGEFLVIGKPSGKKRLILKRGRDMVSLPIDIPVEELERILYRLCTSEQKTL